MKNRNSKLKKYGDIFLTIKFGIVYESIVLLFAKFFRHRLYVSTSKYVYKDI